LRLLCDVIDTLDDASRCALALVFMRGGRVASPVQITSEESDAVERLGGTIGDTLKALESLNESLLINILSDGDRYWQFKHPTVRDAFASVVASSYDLMDIYLKGTPLNKLCSEITCGDVSLIGAGIIVPEALFPNVIEKIRGFDTSNWYSKSLLYRFLSFRCDKNFLVSFLQLFPDFISKLVPRSNLYLCSDAELLVNLKSFGLLPESERCRAVSEIAELAIEIPDAGFLDSGVRGLLTETELLDLIFKVKEELLPNLDEVIDRRERDWSDDDDPESHFEDLSLALETFKVEFADDKVPLVQIESAVDKVQLVINELNTERKLDEEGSVWRSNSDAIVQNSHSRSVFDDVDQ